VIDLGVERTNGRNSSVALQPEHHNRPVVASIAIETTKFVSLRATRACVE
jgi:hypothetical protein